MKRMGLLLSIILVVCQLGIVSGEPSKRFKGEVQANCGNVLLTWEAVPGAQEYDIYRQDDGQSNFERIVQLNTDRLYYKDTKNVVSDKKIKYYINATNDQSEELSRTPEMTAIPGCYDENECSTRLKFQVGNFMYWLNDKMEGPMDAAPEQTNGRVFLVIKYITTNIGAKLEWLASEKRVTITTKSKTIQLWIGKNIAKINGVESKIDSSNDKVAPYISGGRTMLPMRFVGDNLGAREIKWDGDTKTAIILMPKDCLQPDCYNLVVESFQNNVIIGVNSAGFRFTFDRAAIGGAEVAVGDFVTVCGSFELTGDGLSFIPRTGNKITLSHSSWVKGTVVSIDFNLNKISLKVCDGTTKTFSFGSESLISTLQKNFPVGLLVDGDKAITWKYIEREKICSNDDVLTVDLSITEVNCETGYIKGEVIGKTPPMVMTIAMPNKDWCSIKTGTCQKIGYYYDGMSNPIGEVATPIDCPCEFEVMLGKSEIKTSSGSNYTVEFKIKNTGKFEGVFEPYVITKDENKTQLKVSPQSETIPAGQISYFKATGEIDGDFEGEIELEVGAKCRGNSQSKTVRIIASTPVFQVSQASGNTDVPTDENVDLTFDVTNYGDGPITVTGMIDKTDFPGKLTVEPISKEIPDKNSRSFTITGVWNPNAKVGVKYTITYAAMCGKITKTGTVAITSTSPGPIITLVEGKGDAKGLTLLDGSIDWKHYTKSRVEVDWGDGIKEDVKGIPAIHTYKKKGEFKVKVTAFTKEGVNTSKDSTCYWDGPKPIINITDSDWNQPTFTLRGNIDWNTLQPGKLQVDWDDGTKETKSGFPISHAYKSTGVYIITMTAVASTGEEGTRLFMLILYSGLCGNRLSPKPYEVLAY